LFETEINLGAIATDEQSENYCCLIGKNYSIGNKNL